MLYVSMHYIYVCITLKECKYSSAVLPCLYELPLHVAWYCVFVISLSLPRVPEIQFYTADVNNLTFIWIVFFLLNERVCARYFFSFTHSLGCFGSSLI